MERHQTTKDQDIVPSQDMCTIEKLILEVPEDLTLCHHFL